MRPAIFAAIAALLIHPSASIASSAEQFSDYYMEIFHQHTTCTHSDYEEVVKTALAKLLEYRAKIDKAYSDLDETGKAVFKQRLFETFNMERDCKDNWDSFVALNLRRIQKSGN